MLAGNNLTYLYHNSTIALNGDDGKIVWHYQHVVDHWDFDHPFERLLVDTLVTPNRDQVSWINPRLRPGERRKVVTGVPGKTGIVYTLDRQTGEFLWARPTVRQNVVSNIDGATGQVTVNPETLFTAVGQTRFVCPMINGGKNFQAGAYSPQTNTMFYPLQNACVDMTAVEDTPTQTYAISSAPKITPGTDKVGTVEAIDVATGRTVWKHEQRAGTMSLVATGGGLVFGGDTAGKFRAFDQTSGKVLWEVSLGSPVTGYPITYSANGKQFVAVSVGNSLVSTGLNRLTPEIKASNSSNLFVFALD
jgi:alcohol dehydrogenase (cytochrome c)